MESLRRIAQRLGSALVGLGLALKIAFAVLGLALLAGWAALCRARALGEAHGEAREKRRELDRAAKSDEALQEYIERRYEEDK